MGTPTCPRCEAPRLTRGAYCPSCNYEFASAPPAAAIPDVVAINQPHATDYDPRLGRCQSCGRIAPTAAVSFHQHIGALVMMFHRTASGKFCRECIDHHFWQCTGITAACGWWGIISFFITPFCLLMNVISYAGASSVRSNRGTQDH